MNYKSFRMSLVKAFQICLTSSVLFLFASCDDDRESCSPDESPETPVKVIEAGQEIYTQMLLDGEVMEEVIDEIVNFGDENFEMLFHVNKSHKVKGIDVPPGPDDLDCSFYSLTRDEIEGFVKLFAIMKGIAETPQLTDNQKRQAFEELFYLLKESDIELALLIYLSNGSLEQLRAIDKIISQVPARSGYSKNDLNNFFESMVRAQMRPTELLQQLESQNITFSQFVDLADSNNLDLSRLVETRMGVIEIIKTVVDGVVLLSKLIVAFVEKAQPVVNIESVYASMLHQDDLDPLNYYNPNKFLSGQYEMRYGTKLTPMAQCIFRIETYFDARNDNFPHSSFVSRIGIIVEKVRCTAGMHVEGKIAFGTSNVYENDFHGYDAYTENEVIIDYGDALCFSRHGRLKFNVDTAGGYRQTGWKNK